MTAGMEVFRAFPQDAKDFAGFARTKLSMPMLVLSGEKAGGPFLIEQGKMVASNVEGVLVKGGGHWLMEEAPGPGNPEAGRISRPIAFDQEPAVHLWQPCKNISNFIQLLLRRRREVTCLPRDRCAGTRVAIFAPAS